jgi:hypothetical protein
MRSRLGVIALSSCWAAAAAYAALTAAIRAAMG